MDKLVQIINVLSCTADNLFQDMIAAGSQYQASVLSPLSVQLPTEEQRRILDIVATMIHSAKGQTTTL